MMDDVRRAYATLGLPFGAPPAQIKRRYRTLVKTWHPDRFATDPAGQAAACDRLTHINNAYRLLLGSRRRGGGAGRAAPGPARGGTARPSPGSRLTREQIDSMVRAIGTESPVDMLLGSFQERVWPSAPAGLNDARSVSIAVVVVFLLMALAIDLRFGRWAYPLLLWLVIVTAGLSRLRRALAPGRRSHRGSARRGGSGQGRPA
jgi:curved DNA-binding protein CbpA